MPESSERRRHITIFIFLLIVIAVLVASLWQYHQMVVAIYDGATASVYRRMLRPFSSPRDTLGQKPIRAALFHSDAAADLIGVEPANVAGLVRQWEDYLGSRSFAYRRVTDLTARNALEDYNLLILPVAPVMSDEEIEAVKRFLRRGHGVIMTWAAGSRDEAGRWRPSPLLRQVAGIDLGPAVPDGDPLGRITIALNPESPLAVGIDPGSILSLTRFDQPLSAVAREPRAEVGGAWVRGNRIAALLEARDDRARERAVIVHGDYMGGRFVWLGFTIASGAPDPEQRAVFETMLRNAIAWSTRQPVAFKAHWPGGIASGFSLSWRLENQSQYDERLPALAAGYGTPLTTFVAPALLEEAPALVRDLAAAGEVGLLAPVSPDDPEHAPGLAALTAWRQRIAELNGNRRPVGCLLNLPVIPDAWLKALVEARFDYVAGSDYRHLLPHAVRAHRSIPVLTRPHELWLLPTTVMAGEQPPAGSGAAGARADFLLERFNTVHAHNGLFHLNLPAARLDGIMLDRLDGLLSEVRRRRVWSESCAEITEYYRSWGHIRISSDYPTPARFAVQVSNTGVRTVEDLTVFIKLDKRMRAIEIHPTTLGTPPAHPVSEDGLTWRFAIPRIPAGKNFLYHGYRIP